MATIANELLDDPITADGDASFVLGQQSAQQESSIAKTAFASAQNMDFDPFGRLVTRRSARVSSATSPSPLGNPRRTCGT